MLGLIMIILLITSIIAWLWVIGIDNMNKNYPDYKGQDFLDWDDNKHHTENV